MVLRGPGMRSLGGGGSGVDHKKLMALFDRQTRQTVPADLHWETNSANVVDPLELESLEPRWRRGIQEVAEVWLPARK